MVRSLLLDDREVFDLVDHHLLMDEIGARPWPPWLDSILGSSASSEPPTAGQDVGTCVFGCLSMHGCLLQDTRVGHAGFVFHNGAWPARSDRRTKFLDYIMTRESYFAWGEDSIDFRQRPTSLLTEWSKHKMELIMDKTAKVIIWNTPISWLCAVWPKQINICRFRVRNDTC